MLLMQVACLALSLDLSKTGKRIAARTAIMAITTSNSINVNADRDFLVGNKCELDITLLLPI